MSAATAVAPASSFKRLEIAGDRKHLALSAMYLVLLAFLSLHLAKNFSYSMDMLGYIGNAALIDSSDIVQVHAEVYREVRENIPGAVGQHLMGRGSEAPGTADNPALDRSLNPYHAAEFFPVFAIRPLFIEAVHVLHWLGLKFVHGIVLVSVLSYFGIGAVVFFWLGRYVEARFAVLFSGLLMISPPLLNIGGHGTPDCLSTLVAVSALYFLLETNYWTAGFALLLASVYVRTDNVLLTLAVIAYFATRNLKLELAIPLAVVAVASVFAINYFAGNYGLKMLYYESFIRVPLAPAEVIPQFSFTDYAHALRSGAAALAEGPIILFVLLGSTCLLSTRHRAPQALASLTMAAAIAHFLIFPSTEDRFFGPLYIGLALLGITSAVRSRQVEVVCLQPKSEASESVMSA